MLDDETMVAGRRRSRGSTGGGARAEALNRLKALRQGGTRRSEIKIESPIYDTIGEDEYKILVDKRCDDFKSFIVDDDGLGYGNEGEEEDWTKAGAPPSSGDESDGQLERTKRKRPKRSSRHRKRISSMFTSSVFKKGKDDKAAKILSSDSIVDNVIAEFAPDEADRERRRRGNVVLSTGSVKFTQISSITPIKRENLPIVKREIAVASTNRSETVGGKELSKDLRTEVVDEPVGFVIDDSKDVCEVKVEPVVKKRFMHSM